MPRPAENLNGYLRIAEAAEIAGVSPNTPRNWARAGKFKDYRNPLNGYRLFKREDLEALLGRVEHSVGARC